MKSLQIIKKKMNGRNAAGQVVVRHKGGQQKRYFRMIDFKRDKRNVIGKVVGIEYDPNRTVDIALINYADGDKRYILQPLGLQVDDTVVASETADIKIGNALPLRVLPIGTMVHNVELTPGFGGQMARGAGAYATVSAKEAGFVHLKMPSGEVRRVRIDCYGTVGQLANVEWKNTQFKKAGTKRLMGIRPTVRGVAQNPRSHPHGGGEGRSGIGMPTPKNYSGRDAVGRRRRPNKYSDKLILQRRKK